MTRGKKKTAQTPQALEAKLDSLSKRLHKRLRGGKIKSKLSKKGKSSIPGLTYWFAPNK